MENRTPLNLELNELTKVKRFFSLLQRVSSRIQASAPSIKNVNAKGFIDKLEFEVCPTYMLNDFVGNAKSLGWKTTDTRLNDKKHYVSATSPFSQDHQFYFRKKYFADSNTYSVSHIVSNPSKFNSMSEYLGCIKPLIEPFSLNDLKIRRMDLSCDYEMPFSTFNESIDIKLKKSKRDYLKAGKEISGVYFGTGSETIMIYNKSLEQKEILQIKSRIEAQLKGNKLPTKLATDLENSELLISKIAYSNPFINSEIYDITYNSEIEHQEQIKEFKILASAFGFQGAKQQLNKNRNFERDYGHLIKRQLLTPQPADVLIEGVKQFLAGSLH